MRTAVSAIFILAGLALGAVGLLVFPSGHGRLEYMIEVVDPRPASEAEMPAGLSRLGAVRALVMDSPAEGQPPQRVLLLPDIRETLKMSDCALGSLPEIGAWQALAGANSGIKRGTITLAGNEVRVCGLLQQLGGILDESLVMPASEDVEAALLDAGWTARTVRYLLFTKTWHARSEMLARLGQDPKLLPAPRAQILSPARRPPLSRGPRIAISLLLVCVGLFVLAWQARGLTRDELARRFTRR